MNADPEAGEYQPLREPEYLDKTVAVEIRLAFIRKVYGILAVQLLLTIAIAAPFVGASKHWAKHHGWISVIGLVFYMFCVCLITCNRPLMRKVPYNYAVLFLLTCSMGLVVGCITALYSPQSVIVAACITAALFLCLTAYAFFTTSDFTGFGLYILAALLALIIWGLAISILGICGIEIRWMVMVYDLLGVLIFSFFIIYDTQLMMGEYGGHKNKFSIDDYCIAALELYLDIINLFLLLLELMGDRK